MPDPITLLHLALYPLALGGMVGRYLYRRLRRGRRLRRLRRDLERTPELSSSALRDGPAVARGRCQPLDLLEAPVSRRDVLGYRLRLEATLLGSGGPEPILDVTRLADFELEDGERRVKVIGGQAILLLQQGSVTSPPLDELLQSGVRELLAGEGVPDHYLLGSRTIRCTEYRLEPGQEVSTYGVARQVVNPRAPTAGFRTAGWQVELRPPSGGYLFVTDLPRSRLKQVLSPARGLPPTLQEG